MRSMTGYGQASWQGRGCKISVELRSVNQRFLEARFSLPREYALLEPELRQELQAGVARGKVDVTVNRSGLPDTAYAVEVNTALARAYVDAWRGLQKNLRLTGTIDLQPLLARPDIVRIVERRLEPGAELRQARQVFRRALQAFTREREREGKALGRDMQQRVTRLVALHRRLQGRAAAATPEFAARVRQRVDSLAAGVNVTPERLAQEIALLVSRGDVTEELVRLGSHLEAMREALRSREPIGKRMDFLLQEIHREVNTTASKSNDLGITTLTLEARAEIEKLREQVQNVE
jgi:uncharacterized protein (TIGR00255 family)